MSLPTDTLLLSTKLKIPAPRKNYILRKCLFDKLSACEDMSVIFISGGAGTGKTTLLTSFIRETSLKNVCWLTLDSSNVNVYSFWTYFIAAVSSYWEEESLLDRIRANSDVTQMEGLLIALINRLCGETDYYMVLDDVQYIKDEMLVKTLEFFLKSMPYNFHLFLLSREEPPVYLGPLAMSARLLFIDGNQMRLSQEEGISFLKTTLKLTSSERELTELNNYAEGWIGGLQLSVAAGQLTGQLLRNSSGITAEYLTREIYESLTEGEKAFLIKTGVLSYFNAALCSRLMEEFSAADFEHMIEGLIRKNLFIICIDEAKGIYRYHNILSEYLIGQFGKYPDKLKIEFHKKAGDIFCDLGDPEEAMNEYYGAEDYDAILLVAKKMEGRMESWSYLDRIPLDKLMTDVDLAAQCFMYNLGNVRVERCMMLYHKFKEYYGDSDVIHIVKFAESYVLQTEGIIPEYYSLPARQIELLPFGNIAKAMILVENSAAMIEQMQYEEARNCNLKAIQICNGTNVFVEFFAYNQLAQVNEEIGNLNESLSCYARSKELFQSLSLMAGIGINYHFGLLGVYMKRMELQKAEETLKEVKELIDARYIQSDIASITLDYHLAEMMFLTGDNDGGALAVEDLIMRYAAFSKLSFSRLVHELSCAGKLTETLANEYLKELDSAANFKSQPFMRLLRARILYNQGEVKEACKEAEEIMTFSRMHGNKIRLVEADILKIVILSGSKDQVLCGREIDNLLKEAIHYAWEDRILIPFYLDRKILLPLIKELLQREAMKDSIPGKETEFLKEVLEVCGEKAAPQKATELLSEREREVLTELAKGITNREIAENLCISQATVKTHVLSIFSKLQVSSRMLAVEAGRKKGLLRT